MQKATRAGARGSRDLTVTLCDLLTLHPGSTGPCWPLPYPEGRGSGQVATIPGC